MRKNIYALLAIMVFSTISNSANAIEIMGYRSCGKWIQGRETERRSGPTDWLDASSNSDWLLGYLSGLAIGFNKDFLKGTDNPSIYLWVDNYCRANPLKRIDDTADDLAVELIRQKRL